MKKKYFAPACHPDRPYVAKGLCRSCYQRAWLLQSPDHKKLANQRTVASRRKWTPENKHQHVLKRWYDITLDQYRELLERQNFVCAICHKPKNKRNLGVDHDHTTGKIRGLLCDMCNWRVGVLENNDWRLKAEVYLENNNTGLSLTPEKLLFMNTRNYARDQLNKKGTK